MLRWWADLALAFIHMLDALSLIRVNREAIRLAPVSTSNELSLGGYFFEMGARAQL
jgi:hypothetical protein